MDRFEKIAENGAYSWIGERVGLIDTPRGKTSFSKDQKVLLWNESIANEFGGREQVISAVVAIPEDQKFGAGHTQWLYLVGCDRKVSGYWLDAAE